MSCRAGLERLMLLLHPQFHNFEYNGAQEDRQGGQFSAWVSAGKDALFQTSLPRFLIRLSASSLWYQAKFHTVCL